MIAIAGGKGGCGKTTTTLATARALAAAGIHARAVDLDAGMPNLHRMANVDRDSTLAAVLEEGREDPVQRDSRGVEIVPAPRALATLDVSAALDAIRPRDGVALLDCPAGAGPAATAPLRAAEAAILVTTGRAESVEDATKTGRMARSLDVPILGAVVTRTERVSRGVRADLATGRTVAVPHSGDPLDDERVRKCYDCVAGWIEEWLREQQRHQRSGTGDAGSGTPRNTTAASTDRRDSPVECPSCGGVRAPNRRGRQSTRRRDRRSPRSPGREGTRSSSRGGGAPSGRT